MRKDHNSEESRAERNADHVYHCWINRRQDERQKQGLEWEGSLYEFKSLLQFLEYGHEQIKRAYTCKLPTIHRQCSRCEPEPIENNTLTCCLGNDVTKCEILISLKTTVEAERERVLPFNGERPYGNVTDEHLYRLMARTCAWHIYHEACGIQDGHHFRVDTSEGHLLTKGDRMYWDRLYESLASSDPGEEA